MARIIVVGLGNPGTEYETTRHNVGFHVIDELRGRVRKNLTAGKGEYLTASFRLDRKEVALIKPTTYMNNSGEAVIDALAEFDGAVEDLLVVCDDFSLPLGTLRLRAGGSDGGHNGLYSIIYHLNSDLFPRLRCGIKSEVMPPKSAMADFVLSPFDVAEEEKAREMVIRAADAVAEFVRSGMARAMNRFNM